MSQASDLGALLGRRLSYEIVLLHTRLGERLGLSPADHKYLDLIDREGPLTAGRFAELSGLTSGAVTAVLDRLHRAGFVERHPDPRDRRRIMVSASGDRVAEIGTLMAPLGPRVAEITADFTQEELAVVASFLERLLDAVHATRVELTPSSEG